MVPGYGRGAPGGGSDDNGMARRVDAEGTDTQIVQALRTPSYEYKHLRALPLLLWPLPARETPFLPPLS